MSSIDDLPIGVLTVREGVVTAVNAHWTEVTGRAPAASVGTGWLKAVHPDDRSSWARLLDATADGVDAIGELRLVGPSGDGDVWVQVRVHRLAEGRAGLIVTLTEIGAPRDGLTGLLNRSAFLAAVDRHLADGGRPSLVALLFVDFDHFKQVNDRFGHATGDHVLVAACRRVQAATRAGDAIGRLGGDEIGILCPALASRREAAGVATRIVAALEQPFGVGAERVTLGASVGIAFRRAAGATALGLVADADAAMYRAKRETRGGWAVAGSTERRRAALDLREVSV